MKVEAPETWHGLVRAAANTDDYGTLLKLSRRARRLASEPDGAGHLVPVRVGVVSSATVDLMLPILELMLFTAGLRPVFQAGLYGQVTQSLIDVDGALMRFKPQITFVVTAAPHLPLAPTPGDSHEDVVAKAEEACRLLLAPCAVLHQQTGCEIVLDNFHSAPRRPAGNIGARLPWDATSFVRRLNLTLADHAPRYVQIHDVAALVEQEGLDRWFDERYWHSAKQPVSFECLAVYCRQMAGIAGALLGRTKKCLVVDLDNTLWGGVIGDDGLAGIEIGEGSAVGEAFKAIQIYLRQLKERGVLLAVCSKNDDGTARSAFTDHADMCLRLEDFVSFKANWLPKSENIRTIARELNLGLDAIAFFDDNPAEREEVALALPDVAVPDLPEDPVGMLRALDRARLFETTSVSGEDRARTDTYRARQEVHTALEGVSDIGAYLRSLAMVATIEPFRAAAFERITQLVNKTNQFNLTTPRLVAADVELMASDRDAVTCTVRLRDRLADHGLIGVTFGRIIGDQLRIEAWLMSCRVLGRGVERVVYNHLLSVARTRGIRELVGEYKPTPRNGLVRDHYAALGFTRGDSDRWHLPVDKAGIADVTIEVDLETGVRES